MVDVHVGLQEHDLGGTGLKAQRTGQQSGQGCVLGLFDFSPSAQA